MDQRNATAEGWADLLGGSWLGLASTRVYTSYIDGFRAARTHRVIERFVTWLHTAGEICTWQRDVLYAAVDAARVANGQSVARPRVCRETQLGSLQLRFAERDFAPTLGHEVRREGAVSALRVLRANLELQLGPSSSPPVGSLDPGQLVADVLDMSDGAGLDESNRDLFLTLAAYYRWLGQTGGLEAGRADEIATTLAAAGMGARSYG